MTSPSAPLFTPLSRTPWILSPTLDGVFVLAAPLLALAAAIGTFAWLGAGAISAIIVFHVIATVAHHLPTFIRIYGDLELLRRFRWTFILGPLLPFSIAMAALSYINIKGYPLESFFYLMIVLTLWDPWHFLMQHYGFMRIYDRGNSAPHQLTARLDFWLCATWFATTLLLSSDWLTQLLVGLYDHSRIPALLLVSIDTLHLLQGFAVAATGLVTVAYVGYLVWCRRQGYALSWPKLVLSVVTFGVMLLAYTPNALIQALAPGWTFQVGFAVIGVVHVSQYLAIVWRYNRKLAQRPGRARSGLFSRWHSWQGVGAAVLYIGLCLGYGATLTTVHSDRWIMAVLLALGFTSTLMHYYFDGFIWKVRHAQNQDVLLDQAPSEAKTQPLESWWSSSRRSSPRWVLARQFAYFGIPLGLLTAAAWWVWSPPPLSSLDHMKLAQEANQRGDAVATEREIRATLVTLKEELPLVKRRAELKPTAAHYTEWALTVYWLAHYNYVVLPDLENRPPRNEEKDRLAAAIAEAKNLAQTALTLPGEVAHAGRPLLKRSDLNQWLHTWEERLAQLRHKTARL